ncbi:MAG: single-stranded-DNA-specific exonuclease RecJ, single-stranded-DNA-specific exonuclease [Candidatus Peregrinibacteria bacterium GW2011_GWF2_33_10]|nr:MAG: single-stranded-DNA-specific exonuclease RecJ, single-stranded-DNA-specific exonuclease [Candidatus Peregrinibacteria bacterium GW2011_GWF2_33_10]
MSFLNKKWKILNEDKNLPLIKRLLINRGITNETEEENFFSNNYSFHDPFLFKDMDKAVERIAKAIKNNERIMIFGDYDVDGISGSAILIHTLRKLNANVSYRLPSRQKDGYGLQNHFIEEFKNLKVKLVITVDNGIACKEPIDLAKSLDIDVIVTDHHGLPENFPDQAYAIIHPRQQDCQYPFKDLAGAGVAFKLAQALLKSLKIKEAEDFIEDLFDLACLGTIADCTSLTHENRAIVKKGLKKLQNSKWKGLNLIKKKAGIESMTDNDTYAALE